LGVSVDEIALAVLVEAVEEVLPPDALEWDEEAPSPLCGGVLVQGLGVEGSGVQSRRVPVMDLRWRLALGRSVPPHLGPGAGGRRATGQIVVVRGRQRRAGLLVDRVTGFVQLEAPAIAAIPDSLWPRSGHRQPRHLKGLALLDGAWMVLLDVDPLLEVPLAGTQG
jgi:hypothetical protein